jgi:hypothetical protein
MVSDGRYIAAEDNFKPQAYSVLGSQFKNRGHFDSFYASLKDDATKDEFLRVACFYNLLVKNGDWHVTGSVGVVDYLTNSFKLVALFSLIESLSDKQHQEFYAWLCSEDPKSIFPISDKSTLSTLNDKYKNSYGSIRRCVAFFSALPPLRQKALCDAIKVDRQPLVSIKKVADFLYELRSKFVHQAQFVLDLEDNTVFSMKKDKVTQTNLSMETLLETFEEGVVKYFEERKA